MQRSFLFILCMIMFSSRCTTNQERKASDHFDGSNFFNPTLQNAPTRGFFSVMKMWFNSERAKWPEWVENKPYLPINQELQDSEVAVTFVNHATILLQFKDYTILTDPIWSMYASPVSWAGVKRVREPGIPFEQLPKIDLILLSHNHYDHFDSDTLEKLAERFSPKIIVPLGNKEHVKSLGFKDVHEMDWWESQEILPHIKINLTPTQHFAARGLFDRNETLWGAFMIHYRNYRVYFGGDAAFSTHFESTYQKYGAVDLAFLSIGAYLPNWFMSMMHMSPLEAVTAHQQLHARQSIGIHYGTFQLSAEKIDQPQKDLIAALRVKSLSEKEFITLDEGQTTVFSLK